MQTEIQDYFNGLCCPPPPITYNFDVDGDWDIAGITDQASFVSAFNVTTTDFLKIGNNVKAFITPTEFLNLNIGNKYLTNVNYITVENLVDINLKEQLLTKFNPSKPLPVTVTALNLQNNYFTSSGYAESETWANLQTPFNTVCNIQLQGNLTSPAGTTFEAILLGKNASITT
jgi:hypothetical protein